MQNKLSLPQYLCSLSVIKLGNQNTNAQCAAYYIKHSAATKLMSTGIKLFTTQSREQRTGPQTFVSANDRLLVTHIAHNSSISGPFQEAASLGFNDEENKSGDFHCADYIYCCCRRMRDRFAEI